MDDFNRGKLMAIVNAVRTNARKYDNFVEFVRSVDLRDKNTDDKLERNKHLDGYITQMLHMS